MPVLWGQGQVLLRLGLERGCFWILRLWSNSGEKPLVPGQGVADSAGVQALCWEELGLTEPILSPFLLWLVVGSSPAGGRFSGSLWTQPRDPECFLGL